MILKQFILILGFICMGQSSKNVLLHEFHLSKCQIDYNTEEHALQISMHLFIDDFEEALKKEVTDKLYICTKKEHNDAEKYIADYLNQNFQLEVDGEAVSYNFIGKEPSEDLLGVWCYLEVENISSIKKLNVKNKVLMESFEDQKNIVSVNGPNQKQEYCLFMNGKFEKELSF